jgi:hypothetical protein
MHDISLLLRGMQKIKYPIKDAAQTSALTDVMFETISSYSIRPSDLSDMSFIVYNFGKLGFEWKKLPVKLQDWFFRGLNQFDSFSAFEVSFTGNDLLTAFCFSSIHLTP